MPSFLSRSRQRPLVAAAFAVVASALVVGPATAADQAVTIAGFAFAPPTVTVEVGDTVTWTNQDSVAHTATATDGSWDTGDIAQGASASITFSTAGTFTYLCTPHPTMTGTVVVQAPSGGGGGGGGSPTTPPTDVGVSQAGSGGPVPAMLALVAAIVSGALVAAFVVRRPRRRALP
jgi:plastocyanin